MNHSIPVEELLAHEGWLRRIVLELVDEHEAEDVLQETWVAALGERARGLRSPKAWLGQVARNLAMAKRRSAGRRRRRESAAAREEALPSTDSMIERLQAHQRVAQAVADLDEPYRTAVLLRYFEDLTPREIAARLEVSGSTIRSRIQRGIERVRGRLEGTDMRALAVVVLAPRYAEPVAPVTLGARALALGAGVVAMSTRYKLAAAAAVLLSLTAAIVWKTTQPSEPAGGPEVAHTTANVPSATPPTDPAASDVEDERRVVRGVTDSAAQPEPAMGQVFDTRGLPVAGVAVWFHQREHPTITHGLTGVERQPEAGGIDLGVSDVRGRFTYEPRPHGQLQSRGDYVALRYHLPEPDADPDRDAMLVVARRASVLGRVEDPDGRPIEGAIVMGRVDGLLEFSHPLDHTHQLALPAARTDVDGYFELHDVPAIEELSLNVSCSGYGTVQEFGLAGRTDVRLTLPYAAEDRYRVRGSVVDVSGRLVEGATIMLGRELTRSGRFGEFDVRSGHVHAGMVFGAGMPGLQAATDEGIVPRLVAGEHDIDGVVLTLGAPALSIAGTVTDTSGEPLHDAIVVLRGATMIGEWMTVEDFVAGREPSIEYRDGVNARADARTDGDGKFSLGGLSDRPYELFVIDPSTKASASRTFAAGTLDAQLTIDVTTRRRVHGVVETRDGAPIAGVTVRWALETCALGGARIVTPGTAVETDDDGAFELVDVPAGEALLTVRGSELVELERSLIGVDEETPLTLRPWARCRFRVELDEDVGTRIEILDREGEVLDVRRTTGQVAVVGEGWDLRRGRTPVLEVSQAARTLRILRDGAEIARHPIALGATSVSVLRF